MKEALATTLSWVQTRAGRLRVAQAGTGEPAVLLVHSNGGDRTHWGSMVPQLARTRRTVSFDLRGMGESEVPTDGDYSLQAMADDVLQLADALGLGRFALVGHSLGASVVAAVCQRVPSRVAGAMFLDGTGDLRAVPQAALDAWRADMEPERFSTTVRAWFTQLLAPATAETRARVLRTLERTPRAAYVGAMNALLQFDPATAIRSYSGPKALLGVRILDGPLALRTCVPEVECELFDDVSHWLQLDQPEAVNESVESFLATLKA